MKNVIRSYPTHPLTDCIDRREKLLKHFDQTYSKLDAESQNKLRKFKRELKKLPPSDSFWRIIEKSLSLDIVDEKEANIWKFIIELRNCTVHNNAIASRDCQVNIDGRSFQLKAEQMIRDKLDFSIFLTRKVLDCFFSWVQRFDAPQSCECQE